MVMEKTALSNWLKKTFGAQTKYSGHRKTLFVWNFPYNMVLEFYAQNKTNVKIEFVN